jgi:hypothetical protein
MHSSDPSGTFLAVCAIRNQHLEPQGPAYKAAMRIREADIAPIETPALTAFDSRIRSFQLLSFMQSTLPGL